jgi:glyoxylase I family protein
MIPVEFSHVAVNCKDPIATEHFYTRYFGFKRARVVPIDNGQIVFIKSGPLMFELFPSSDVSPIAAPVKDGYTFPGWRHLAFKVPSVDEKLKEMGADACITLGPFSFDEVIPGWRTVWVSDPEGNIVEISQGYVDQDDPPALEA